MINPSNYPTDCTGDACLGDTVLFTEAVFGGSHRKPRFLGRSRIAATVVRDSYGACKQQHTFSIQVIASDGFQPLTPGHRRHATGPQPPPQRHPPPTLDIRVRPPSGPNRQARARQRSPYRAKPTEQRI